MPSNTTVPTLELSSLYELHFGDKGEDFEHDFHFFDINRLEDARDKITFPIPPHRKPMHDLIFIKNGRSIRSKGMNTYSFEANELFFLPALQITSHEFMSKDVEGFFFQFSPALFSEVHSLVKSFKFLKFSTDPIVRIPEKVAESVVVILERILSLYVEGKQSENKDLVLWYIMALFTEIDKYSSIDKVVDVSTSAKITQQFKDSLSQYIYEYRTVKEFADLLHLTPNHLNKCVKKTLNTTAQSLLNEMLILEAKSLLKYSDLSISQIAERLCKATPSNFSRFFKGQTGLSPKAFRSPKS